jgi:hypothetical protein
MTRLSPKWIGGCAISLRWSVPAPRADASPDSAAAGSGPLSASLVGAVPASDPFSDRNALSVKRFAELYAELDETTKTGEKVDALAAYFATTGTDPRRLPPSRRRAPSACA